MPNTPRDSTLMLEVGRRLAATRKALDLTQAQLAEQLGITRTRLANWEVGRGLPDVDTMLHLNRRHSISLDWVYRGDLSNLPHHLAKRLLRDLQVEQI